MKDSPRILAVKALLRVHENNGYSNLVLGSELVAAGLNARDKAFVTALFYGVLERRITLDYVIATHADRQMSQIEPFVKESLRVGAYQILYLEKVPDSAAVNEAVDGVKQNGHAYAAGFVNGVLRAIQRDGKNFELPPEKNRATHMSIRYSCPKWLIKLWDRAYGKEACEAMLRELPGRPPLTVRSNSQKGSREELIARLTAEGVEASAVPWMPQAVLLQGTGAVEELSAFQNGLFHVQDLSSQLCCFLFGARPGETVVDVCSAPGGKAFTIAQWMKNSGRLLAYDLYESRVKLIQNGANRLGLQIIEASQRDAAEAQSAVCADRVLCDVPCSGLGIIRRKPEIREKPADTLDNLPELQYRILCRSSQMLKPGGLLFYSTCTLNPAENDEVAARFLREHPDFTPFHLPLPSEIARGREEPEYQITLLPHLYHTDGFFIAGFIKE